MFSQESMSPSIKYEDFQNSLGNSTVLSIICIYNDYAGADSLKIHYMKGFSSFIYHELFRWDEISLTRSSRHFSMNSPKGPHVVTKSQYFPKKFIQSQWAKWISNRNLCEVEMYTTITFFTISFIKSFSIQVSWKKGLFFFQH